MKELNRVSSQPLVGHALLNHLLLTWILLSCLFYAVRLRREKERRGFLRANTRIQHCISQIGSYFLIPLFYSAEMCDICSDGESDRDCIFDKSLSTASGPGKQREMGLQVKKKSSEISRQMYYWNSMTTKSFWTLKGTVH